ncbi:MAG TPA: CoA transferase [Dehalococcoidia bacterium]|nr:CoA transferase [Dehalococcoidia bacterium]
MEPGAFSGWRARLDEPCSAGHFLGWLLQAAGAEVNDADGARLGPAALALRLAGGERRCARGQLTLSGPRGERYTARFVAIDRPELEDGDDAAAWAWGGLASVTGEPDGPPLAPGAPVAGICAALHAALAFAAGRYRRLAAIAITVPLADVVASLLEVAGLRYAADGSVRGRGGDWWGMAGWGLYPCADGKLAIALRDLDQLHRLAELLGLPELRDARFDDFIWGISTAGEELHALLLAGLLSRPLADLLPALRRERIAAAAVRPLDAVLADPHLRARDAFEQDGGLWLPRFPARITPSPAPPRSEIALRAMPARRGRGDLKRWDEADSKPAATRSVEGTEQPPKPITPRSQRIGEGAGEGARPLRGVRVLDISAIWAGPLAARLLAELGATVTKLERTDRRAGTFSTGAAWDRNFYAMLNDRNKQPFTWDLTAPADRAAFLELVGEADVLIENFVPGSLDRAGLSRAALHAANPRLVTVSLPAQGLSGPDASAVGYGSTIEQAAGLGWLYTDAAGEPHRSGVNFSDPIAGLYGAIGAVLALCGERNGTAVELSQQEAALSLMLPAFAAFQQSGTIPRAREAAARDGGWCFVDAAGRAVPVRDVAEVVGRPRAAGSRAVRWLRHPDGRSYPLVVLPWRGAFSRATAPRPAQMPRPLAEQVEQTAL